MPVWSAHAGGNPSELDRDAEHAHAADRFAHKIRAILTVSAVRSRQLMGRPFGVRGAWDAPFFDMIRRMALPQRPLCLPRGVPAPVVERVVRRPVVRIARYAAVVRRPVVLIARYELPDRMLS